MLGCLEMVSNDGSFINRDEAPQLFGNLKTDERRAVTGEWELSGGASFSQSTGEAAVSLPDSFSPQAHMLSERFAWFRPEQRHINPASQSEAPEGRQFQFARKLIFESKKHPRACSCR